MAADPQPFVKFAFRVRDLIVAPFVVKTAGRSSGKKAVDESVGDYLDFSLVEYVDNETLTLTNRENTSM